MCEDVLRKRCASAIRHRIPFASIGCNYMCLPSIASHGLGLYERKQRARSDSESSASDSDDDARSKKDDKQTSKSTDGLKPWTRWTRTTGWTCRSS